MKLYNVGALESIYMSEVWSLKSEVRSQKSEVGSRRSEVRSPKCLLGHGTSVSLYCEEIDPRFWVWPKAIGHIFNSIKRGPFLKKSFCESNGWPKFFGLDRDKNAVICSDNYHCSDEKAGCCINCHYFRVYHLPVSTILKRLNRCQCSREQPWLFSATLVSI